MKRMLVGATALSLLLAGCGQGEERKKEETKTAEVTTEEKVKSISDKEINAQLQKYIDTVSTEFGSVQSLEGSSDREGMMKAYITSGNKMLDAGKNIQTFIDNNDEPQKYTQPIKDFKQMNDMMSKYIVDVGKAGQQTLNGEMTQEQLTKKIDDLTSDMQTKTEIEDKGMAALDKFKQFGLETTYIDQLFNQSESSNNENQQSTASSSDPINFIKTKSTLTSEDGSETYELVKVFKNNNTDKDGFNKVDNNGFVNNLAFALVKDTNTGEYALGYFGENQNNTDQHIEFLGGIEFTTDTGEQIRPEGGALTMGNKLIKEYNPGVKSKGYGVVKLDYQDQIPNSIDVVIEQPHNNDADLSNYEWGQVQNLHLTAE